jgi:hypothetical protein
MIAVVLLAVATLDSGSPLMQSSAAVTWANAAAPSAEVVRLLDAMRPRHLAIETNAEIDAEMERVTNKVLEEVLGTKL